MRLLHRLLTTSVTSALQPLNRWRQTLPGSARRDVKRQSLVTEQFLHGIESGPSRATAGPGKPLSRGPVTASFRCTKIETLKASRWMKRRHGCPLTIRLWIWGACVVSSPLGSGAEPRPKMNFMHISGQKEAIWYTIFSILSDGAPPPKKKRRGARENFPPSPSGRACIESPSSATTRHGGATALSGEHNVRDFLMIAWWRFCCDMQFGIRLLKVLYNIFCDRTVAS